MWVSWITVENLSTGRDVLRNVTGESNGQELTIKPRRDLPVDLLPKLPYLNVCEIESSETKEFVGMLRCSFSRAEARSLEIQARYE
jgi:hypothetical protein